MTRQLTQGHRPSPSQIRAAAALAWRNHVRRVHVTVALPLRPPSRDETPLSQAEVRFAAERGLIRAGDHHAGA